MNGFYSIFFSLVLITVPLMAETPPPTNETTQKEISEHAYETATGIVMAAVGISPESKIAERFLKKIKSAAAPPKRANRFTGKRRTIIKHLRFEEGISFPTEKELSVEELRKKRPSKKLPPPPGIYDKAKSYRFTYNDKEKKKTFLEVQKQFALQTKEIFTPTAIEKCSMPKTESSPNQVQEIPFSRHQKKGDLLFDILYLAPDAPDINKMGSDAAELFGKTTLVTQYSTNEGDFASLMASKHKVPCLPFRLRVTKSHITRYYGRDALKNFDLSKKGKFHLIIEKRIHDFS